MDLTNCSELFRACHGRDRSSVERLLRNTSISKLHKLEPNGSSCLHIACSNGDRDIIIALIERGSDRQLRDKDGRTPADLATDADIAEILAHPGIYVRHRFGDDPLKQPQWLYDQDSAEQLSRAIEWGCIKNRGIMKTVRKLQNVPFIQNDLSTEGELLRFYLNEAREKNDASYFLKIYTIQGPFFSELNNYMVTGGKNKVYRKLCHKWSGYYAGIIMRNPELRRFYFSGVTYRGMQITLYDLEQYKKGFALTNKAFQSTTKMKKVALQFTHKKPPKPGTVPALLTYFIRNEKSALDISSLSEFPEEQEVLMLPGCCFRVTNVEEKEADAEEKETSVKISLVQLVWDRK